MATLMDNITFKRSFMLICLNQHPINNTSAAAARGAFSTLPAMLADAGVFAHLAPVAYPAEIDHAEQFRTPGGARQWRRGFQGTEWTLQ